MMHPLSSDGITIHGRIIPKFCFSFPGTLHLTVFLYYGRQVSEACNITMTYGVKDSLVRAITAENRDCVFLAAILYPVHNQEESGLVMMYYFLRPLPDLGEIAYD